jgi:G:T-mismatch repair DNA endonuclease (very short patch repair protein)
MEQSVAWPQHSNDNEARRAAALLDDAVTAIRNRGHTREYALRQAAKEFGLRFRRARAILYGEPVVLLDSELARIRAAFLAHLDAEAEHLAARSAAARERLRRMRDGES